MDGDGPGDGDERREERRRRVYGVQEIERERRRQTSGKVWRICVMLLPAAIVGKNRFDVKWMYGVWLGIKPESGESFIGATR